MSLEKYRHSKTWKEVIELIGPDAAQRLARALPGDRIYFSSKQTDLIKACPVRVAELIGHDKAAILARHFRGCVLDVCTEHAQRRLMRDRKIIHGYTAGMCITELCRQYSLGRRRIYQILKQPIDAETEISA